MEISKKISDVKIRNSLLMQQALVNNDFETEKTAGMVECLLERAELTVEGIIPEGRWNWVKDSYTSPEKMVQQAEEFVSNMEAGIFRLEGKFAEPGFSTIDHCIIKRSDEHHLFYIRNKAANTWAECPSDNFGHAVSKDLKKWDIKKPVLQCIEGTWDCYQVWAPHIVEFQGEYWMFYTGVNYNATQAIGIAKSKDLYNWERCEGNPVIKTGSWGPWSEDAWSDCRDPMVLQDGKIFYAYYCTAKFTENGVKSALGVSSSWDLVNWRDEGAYLLPTANLPPESPFVVKKDNKYYLFYFNYSGGTAFAYSDNPINGWQELLDGKNIIIPGVSASEVYFDDGKWYITLISHQPNQLHFLEIRDLQWGEDGFPYV